MSLSTSRYLRHTWAGEKSLGGFCLYLYVISFDFDSGVGIPVTLTFWPWGVNTLETPPAPMRDLRYLLSTYLLCSITTKNEKITILCGINFRFMLHII